ncbi:MAG: DUF4256 domain-containing protein [Burkholderiaceae bacterium]
MTPQERDRLLHGLQDRFERHMQRHRGLAWADAQQRLLGQPEALRALNWMDATGGEPDVIGRDADTFLFCDCSPESPPGRRSLCYDRPALDARKANKPGGSAIETASEAGLSLLDEAQYRRLQTLGEFDTKTSSWLLTPPEMRGLGGALFGDRRFGRVFIYHNGADSYYAARGFRTGLRV